MAQDNKTLQERIAEREAKKKAESESYGPVTVPSSFVDKVGGFFSSKPNTKTSNGLLGAPAEDVAGAAAFSTPIEPYQEAKAAVTPPPAEPKAEELTAEDKAMAKQAVKLTPATKEEGSKNISATSNKIQQLPETPEKDQLKADIAKIDKWYQDQQDKLDWFELADRLGQALTQIGAAYWGLRTGTNMAGLEFQPYDWSKRRQLTYQTMRGQKDDRLARAKLTQQDEQFQTTDKRKGEELDIRRQEAGIKAAAASAKSGIAANKAQAALSKDQQKAVESTTAEINSIFKNDRLGEEEKLDMIRRTMLSKKDRLGLSADEITQMTEKPGWFWTGGSEEDTAKAIEQWLSSRSAGSVAPPSSGGQLVQVRKGNQTKYATPENAKLLKDNYGWQIVQ